MSKIQRWEPILRDLVNSGLSQSEIERRTGLAQPTVSAILAGRRERELMYTVGARVMDLWRERCATK